MTLKYLAVRLISAGLFFSLLAGTLSACVDPEQIIPTQPSQTGFRIEKKVLAELVTAIHDMKTEVGAVKAARDAVLAQGRANASSVDYDQLNLTLGHLERGAPAFASYVDLSRGDIESLIAIVFVIQAEEAERELSALVETMTEANQEKKVLRDHTEELRKRTKAARNKAQEAYHTGARTRVPEVALKRGTLIAVSEGRSGKHTIESDNGGGVSFDIECALSPNSQATLTATLTDSFTGKRLANSRLNSGRGSIEADIPSGQPTAVTLEVKAEWLAPVALLPCDVLTQVKSTRPLRFRPIDPKKADQARQAVATLKSKVTDFSTVMSKLLQTQPSKDKLEFYRFVTNSFAKAGTCDSMCTSIGYDEANELASDLDDVKDSVSEMSVDDMSILQTLMDHKSELEQMVSEVMRESSEASSEITSALKD